MNEPDLHELSDEEFIALIHQANPGWPNRIRQENTRLLYDWESDIIALRFGGNHKFGYLFSPETVRLPIEIKIEDDGLRIIGVDVMHFRGGFLPCYPELKAAFDSVLHRHGDGDLFLDIPPGSPNEAGDGEAEVARLLSNIAHGLIIAPALRKVAAP